MTDTVTSAWIDDDVDHRLISSRRIEGAPVFDRCGQRVGSIHSVMIDKRSGVASYAVLTFGGFLGMGARAYPLPWAMLNYDGKEGGYCLELKRQEIEDAPWMTLDRAERPRVTEEPAYRHWDQYL